MPNHLYISNSIEKLADQLSVNLQNEHCAVFQQQHIITQTAGMNKWLTEKIALQLGITAQLAFHSPNDIIALLHEWLSEKPSPVITSDKIRWKLWKELNDPAFQQRFPNQATYYENHPIRQIALAEQMADLFDQYQIYRHGMISDWNDATQAPNEFQWYLWKKLQQTYAGKITDKPTVLKRLEATLTNADKQNKLQDKVAGLHFFGIAVITPLHLELFQLLAKYIPLHFYLMNPAPLYYWLDDDTEKSIIKKRQKNKLRQPDEGFNLPGNTLLTGWGKTIKESFALLYKNEDLMNEVYDDWVVAPADNPSSLLQVIQKDIFENAHGDLRQPIQPKMLRDGSLIINSCYTRAREVEVLYNELVKLADAKPGELAPKDILVLCSDIDAYAPYIRAVFNHAPYTFDYTISDQKITEGASLFADLKRLLELTADNMKAETVMELLESKNISAKFNITQFDLIRTTIQEANIRCGISGEAENDTRLVSWEYGLQRMSLGWCMSGGKQYTTPSGDTLLPVDTVEGDNIFELVRFHHFATQLLQHLEIRKIPRTVSNWVNYVRELLEEMLLIENEQESGDYHEFISFLDKYQQQANDIDDLVSYEVFAYQFTGALQSETRQMMFGRGGVLFCSLIPMRSIPHKVVAILGMNYNEFPRKDSRPHFDLQKQNPLPGDRNIRNNDKHLLLETILSAKEHLIISYQGLDVKDNATIPPASLIDELIQYIIEGLPQPDIKLRNSIIVKHPLHSFNSRYGSGGVDGLTSYLSPLAANPLLKKMATASSTPAANQPMIELASLSEFAKSPITWFFKKTWQVKLYNQNVLLNEIESFEMSDYEKATLKNELLKSPPAEYENVYQQWLLEGKLPLSNLGKVLYQTLATDVQPLYEELDQVRNGAAPSKIRVKLDLGIAMLTGMVDGVYGNKIIALQTSSHIRKQFFPAFINFCSLRAMNLPVSFHFFKKKGGWVHCEANRLSPEKATELLQYFIEHYLLSTQKPFLFFTEWSKPNVMNYFKNGKEKYAKDLKIEALGSYDEYIKLALESGFLSEQYYDEVKMHVEKIYPMLLAIHPSFFTESRSK